MAEQKLVSRLAEQEIEKKERKTLIYSDEEKQQARQLLERLKDSFETMNAPLSEFDGESLITTCTQNRLSANSFLTSIINDGDVRVVTGTTEGKLDSVFNSVFNQNLETDVRAFDEYDLEDYMLGDKLSKIVKRTKQIERDEDFWESALREILTVPAVFIQETMEDEWYYDRVLEEGDWEDLWQFKIPKFKKVGWLRKREAKKVLWTAEQVFLADIRIPMRLFHKQPYVITYRTRTWDDVERIYRNSPRFDYIHPGAAQQQNYKNLVEDSEWRFTKQIKANEVEEIILKSVQGDEMQIWLNGVPMLPVGCPLITTRMKIYDMTMEGGKEIHPKFAYRRPLVSMVKVMQALKDENFRLMILRHRQNIWKPIVTKAKAILSKDMWLPSAITYGVDKSEIETIAGENASETNIDIAMNKMVEAEIEKFINISSIFQGLDSGTKMTAHEVAQRMKQALVGLGASLTGYIRAVRNCDYLRLFNILENMTKPIDTRYNDYLEKSEDVYRTFTIGDADLYDGKIGSEIISFINRPLLKQEKKAVIDQEKQSREEGKPKAFSFIPVDVLLKAKYMFYIDVNVTEKRTSILESEMAKKDLTDSVAFARSVGAQINPDYATEEWSKRVRKIDGRKLFVIPQQQAPQAPGQEIPGGQPPAPGGAPSGAQPPAPAPGPALPPPNPKVGAKQMMQADSMK